MSSTHRTSHHSRHASMSRDAGPSSPILDRPLPALPSESARGTRVERSRPSQLGIEIPPRPLVFPGPPAKGARQRRPKSAPTPTSSRSFHGVPLPPLSPSTSNSSSSPAPSTPTSPASPLSSLAAAASIKRKPFLRTVSTPSSPAPATSEPRFTISQPIAPPLLSFELEERYGPMQYCAVAQVLRSPPLGSLGSTEWLEADYGGESRRSSRRLTRAL
ncbi:hypothetical protein JCM10207_000977 [Rhodosporidiobolus poonsookiae]